MDLTRKQIVMRGNSDKIFKIIKKNRDLKGFDNHKLLSEEYLWISNHRSKKFQYLFYNVREKMHEMSKILKQGFEEKFIVYTEDPFDFYRDIFFFYGASILDVFARELSCFYPSYYENKNNIFMKDVYFKNFIQWLNGGRRDFDKELPSFLNAQQEEWIDDFLAYRHYVVHIGALDNLWQIPEKGERMYDLLLPDDPKVRPDKYTYDKKIESVRFCENFLERLIAMLDYSFNVILIHIDLH